jgi:NADH-quinone oxidoreductase subunit N
MYANNSLLIILPGIVLAVTAGLVFAVDLFVRRKAILAWLAGAGLVAAAAVAVGQWLALTGDATPGEPLSEVGWAGMVALDQFALFGIVLFAAIGVLTIMLSDSYLAQRRAARGEFYGLLLLVVTGMIGLVASTDIIFFFVSFELMSLPTYVLTGYLWRDERSGEASLKYFVTGAFSSAILAFGLALLYGSTGETNYAAISEGLALQLGPSGTHLLLVVALVLTVAGFGFKVSIVPFHGWAPDVYEGAPTPVTTFMSVGIKAAAFAGFARLFVVAVGDQWATWGNALIILAILTMIVGNVLALPQRNLKRMLAYSSIAHAGYITLGLIVAGRGDDALGMSAILFYLAAYACMNLGAFGVLIWVRNRRPYDYSLDGISGLARAMPWAGIFMAFFMISLTGIPPTIGFWAKFYLFTAVVQGGYTWLAVVAVIMSAVSAYYYLRVVWYMYFRDADDLVAGRAAELAGDPAPAVGARAAARTAGDPTVEPMAGQLGVAAAVGLAAAGVLVLGLFPEPLLNATEVAVRLILG